MIDYSVFRIIWWLLLGVLLAGFAVTEGFDLGAMMLLGAVGRSDAERRIVINTVGPVWEGNQVWLVLGAGAIFAAWPTVYSVAFSGFYLAMFVVLLALIARPVSFKYRSKGDSQAWRNRWDISLMSVSFVIALIFGVAIGNVIQGVPFHFDQDMRVFYTGHFLQLLNPFALLCGLASVAMMVMHGGLYLAIKTEGVLQKRSLFYARLGALILIVLLMAGGLWLTQLKGYHLLSAIDLNGPSNPLHKTVGLQIGQWLAHYQQYPILWSVPICSLLGAFVALLIARIAPRLAFVGSALSILSVIALVGVSLFPFILPSSSHPSQSLLVFDASSSQLTLMVMLGATLVFIPIILAYTAWVYHVLKGKVNQHTIQQNPNAY